jgi:Zn-finger nucleic acid-binding protein
MQSLKPSNHMAAKTLNCPMCGAAAAREATRCEHCSSKLATIACPSCFGMVFLGAKFCSHCGSSIARQEVNPSQSAPCPLCKVETTAVRLGDNHVRECLKCEGLWVDSETTNQIYADRERQAAVLGTASVAPVPSSGALDKVRYIPCPVCQELMHRVNFAQCSYVIVDVCKAHGTWFDRNELHRIIGFIRAGGMDKARAREIEELERKRRAAKSARPSSSAGSGSGWYGDPSWTISNDTAWEIGASVAELVVRSLLK